MALGVEEASVYAARTGTNVFAGEAVGGPAVLVRYTLAGDANLDGVVDDRDVDLFVRGYGAGTMWSDGDFNYDGVVGDADLDLLASTVGYTGQSGVVVTAAGVAKLEALRLAVAVPEPSLVGMVGVIGLGAVGRRRRSRR